MGDCSCWSDARARVSPNHSDSPDKKITQEHRIVSLREWMNGLKIHRETM